MSGRSAFVRKEKTKIKESSTSPLNQGNARAESRFGAFPPQTHNNKANVDSNNESTLTLRTVRSSRSDLDSQAYARACKPNIPDLEISGIEKSSFRSMIDKRSDGFRKGLAKSFTKRKPNGELVSVSAVENRPHSSSTGRASYESNIPAMPALVQPPRAVYSVEEEPAEPNQSPPPSSVERLGPPKGKLPPVPQLPQLKRWTGFGRPAQSWNKLRKDPELWDHNGDTLVFFGLDDQRSRRPPPSLRISSHVIEATESRFLITLLREGCTEIPDDIDFPQTPGRSSLTSPFSRSRTGSSISGLSKNIRPMSPASDATSAPEWEGQISYEIYFPAPRDQSKAEVMRHHANTRNVFALLYQTSIVGLNLFQALRDLHERLEQYMGAETDSAALIADYLRVRGLDDVRNDPTTAAEILAWCECPGVQWQDGWNECFLHCAGMYNRLESSPDIRHIHPITRALLERANLEMQVRVQSVEERFAEFNFDDMWPLMTPKPTPARSSFQRVRKFFVQYYEELYGSWPPPKAAKGESWNDDIWLDRSLTQKLQSDFAALYDYLVDWDIVWDCTEERATRKWNLVSRAGDRAFCADTIDIPYTDILVAFDNRHLFPHIPHAYPLTPESRPPAPAKESMLFRRSKEGKTHEDRILERKVALAYTEATNIYQLGSNFAQNDLVDAFMRFEKTDRVAEVDPFAARRGRWVLIYGILQTLALISVDTPSVRYNDNVGYYLNPRLRGTPPWHGARTTAKEPCHETSHCWTAARQRSDPLHTVTSASTTSLHSSLGGGGGVGGSNHGGHGGGGGSSSGAGPSAQSSDFSASNTESEATSPATPPRSDRRGFRLNKTTETTVGYDGARDDWPNSDGRTSSESAHVVVIRDFDSNNDAIF